MMFAVAYSAMHGAFASDAATTLVPLAVFLAVITACLWLAFQVKCAVTRDK